VYFFKQNVTKVSVLSVGFDRSPSRVHSDNERISYRWLTTEEDTYLIFS